MLFIKPTIVRSKNDLVGFTERKYGAIRDRQIEASSRSEYLIRDLQPSVMPPLDGSEEVTRAEDVLVEPEATDDTDTCDGFIGDISSLCATN